MQLPEERTLTEQHQHNDENEAHCQAAMDAEAAEEWTVPCRTPQPSSKSRQTVGVSHALPLVGVPGAGPSKGLPAERQRTWSALILSNPATARIGRLCRRKVTSTHKKLS